MRRRLAVLLAAVLVAGIVVGFGPAGPASATNVCVGQGTANVGAPGLLAPLMPLVSSLPGSVNVLLLADSAENNLPFFFALGGSGVCTTGGPLTAAGTVSGYCGQSGGQGTDTEGHLFGWVSAGTFLLVTGELTGVLSAVANPLIANNSCFTGHPNHRGATQFLVTGAVIRLNCATITLHHLLTLQGGGLEILPLLTFLTIDIHLGSMATHSHANVHVCVGAKL